MVRPIDILLAEDNPGDVDLTLDSFEQLDVPNRLHVVSDGVEALAFVRQEGTYQAAPRPDLILLDLNLPRKDGREVLADLKEDDRYKTIPIVVLSSSEAEADILTSYALHANCYLTKPLDLGGFTKIVRGIESFWLGLVKLPPKEALS
jgi:CheY-like chemotaxis protein